MSNSSDSLALWAEKLSITLRNGINVNQKIDFNRLRYIGVPSSKLILSGPVESANRDSLVLRIFNAITSREESSSSTKIDVFDTARRHMNFCDQNGFLPLTKDGVMRYLNHINLRQRRGEIKDSSETQMRASLSRLLQWLELPVKSWLPSIPTSRKTQSEPTRGYSDNDLKKILPLLRGLFKQLYKQFVMDPNKHIGIHNNSPTMTFIWQDQEYKICGGVNKLFCCATFIMSYYTWSNSSVLYQLERPNMVSSTLSDDWHQMPAFKRRAFKTISVEIGSHGQLEIPKYALQFFDQLLHVSRLLNPGLNKPLLSAINSSGKIIMMHGTKLNDFKARWLHRYFPMKDDFGERLWPVIQRFRASGGQMALARRGIMNAAQLLDNTPNVVKLSYSSGNQYENSQMNRDTSHTLEQAVRDRQGIQAAKQKVMDEQNISVLAYEAYVQHASPPSRSANGSYCKSPLGDRSLRYSTHVRQQGLIPEGTRLACADILQCWVCEHQILVESVNDIWCILSFRECLIESQYQHIDNKHFFNNFGETIFRIDSRIKLINQKVLKKAIQKMANEGRHPLWVDISSVSIFGGGQ